MLYVRRKFYEWLFCRGWLSPYYLSMTLLEALCFAGSLFWCLLRDLTSMSILFLLGGPVEWDTFVGQLAAICETHNPLVPLRMFWKALRCRDLYELFFQKE